MKYRRLAAFALSIGGYLVTAYVLAWMHADGRFGVSDLAVWDRVGDEVRAGVSPYWWQGTGGFFYAPPWALAFAAVSWLPPVVMAGLILAAEITSLRYIAGSWLRVGWLCWFPFLGQELAQLQVNLIAAACIAAAVRGHPGPAILGAMAKIGPALAIDPRQWRRTLPWVAASFAVTLPFLGLWIDWVNQLIRTLGTDIAEGATIPIPLELRLLVALPLVLTGKPWARVIAATIATPALYKITFVMLFAAMPSQRRVGVREPEPDVVHGHGAVHLAPN